MADGERYNVRPLQLRTYRTCPEVGALAAVFGPPRRSFGREWQPAEELVLEALAEAAAMVAGTPRGPR
jgi:hypothetical protein